MSVVAGHSGLFLFEPGTGTLTGSFVPRWVEWQVSHALVIDLPSRGPAPISRRPKRKKKQKAAP